MCCRSPAITWRWSRAWCSSSCARCWRCPGARRAPADQEMGRCRALVLPRRSILLLSGAEVATQRSFIMTAIVLLGVMVDRPALTLRTLAIAALAVLLLAPEAVVHPSFQMSFAATLALIAAYRARPAVDRARRRHTSLGARVALWGGARDRRRCVLASLVAGLATTPYAAYPFPPACALRRARQPAGHADRLGLGDAGRPAGAGRHAVRLRRAAVAADGLRHRLDDRRSRYGSRACRARSGACPRSAPAPLLLGTLRADRVCPACGRRCAGAARAPRRCRCARGGRTPRPDVLVAADGDAVAVRGADGRLAIIAVGERCICIARMARAPTATPARRTTGPRRAASPAIRCGCIAHACRRDDRRGRPDGRGVRGGLRARRAGHRPARRAADCAALVIDRKLCARTGAIALRRIGQGCGDRCRRGRRAMTGPGRRRRQRAGRKRPARQRSATRRAMRRLGRGDPGDDLDSALDQSYSCGDD